METKRSVGIVLATMLATRRLIEWYRNLYVVAPPGAEFRDLNRFNVHQSLYTSKSQSGPYGPSEARVLLKGWPALFDQRTGTCPGVADYWRRPPFTPHGPLNYFLTDVDSLRVTIDSWGSL
ncbi:hypothetical protein TNCV_3901021 [Trichonephila clavipes]|nr:hypothetical protein TNCV_3901021 [Trichonephila clavipes]